MLAPLGWPGSAGCQTSPLTAERLAGCPLKSHKALGMAAALLLTLQNTKHQLCPLLPSPQADEAESLPAPPAGGLKRFGGKVAPRPPRRPRPDNEEEADQEDTAAAGASPPSSKKQRPNATPEGAQLPAPPREASPGPATPHANGAADAGAPATPTAAAAAAAAAAASAGSGGPQASAVRVVSARWRRTTSGGSRLGPAAGLELAVSSASAALSGPPPSEPAPPPASSRRPARRRRTTTADAVRAAAAASAAAAAAAAAAAGQDAEMADAEADATPASAAAETVHHPHVVVELVSPASPHSAASPFALDQDGSGFLPLLEEPVSMP